MEETKEEKIELKSITADGESPPTTKVRSCLLPGAVGAVAEEGRPVTQEMEEEGIYPEETEKPWGWSRRAQR